MWSRWTRKICSKILKLFVQHFLYFIMRCICDLITLRHTIFLFLISSKIVRRLENPYLRLVRPHKDRFEVNLVEVTFWINMHPWNALCNSCNTFLQEEKQFSSMMKNIFLKETFPFFALKVWCCYIMTEPALTQCRQFPKWSP